MVQYAWVGIKRFIYVADLSFASTLGDEAGLEDITPEFKFFCNYFAVDSSHIPFPYLEQIYPKWSSWFVGSLLMGVDA